MRDADLTSEFKTFCDRREWGVRALTLRGSGLIAAAARGRADHEVPGTFDPAQNAVQQAEQPRWVGGPLVVSWDDLGRLTVKGIDRLDRGIDKGKELVREEIDKTTDAIGRAPARLAPTPGTGTPAVTSALTRLLDIAPAPADPRHKDWTEVERALGVDLPDDYKELIGAYGGSNWDDYLYVLEPGCPNPHYDLLKWAEYQAEELEGLWEFEKKPAELETDGSRVIPWATTDNGECLYWLVPPGADAAPKAWTVMVNEARGARWEHYDVSCTRFLAGSLDGELRSDILSSAFPRPSHQFRRLGPA